MIKLLANENFPLASVLVLRKAGYDITYIAEENKSISDAAVMNMAIEEERLILTFDRDYGELIFKHNYTPRQGIIYLRLLHYTPEEPGSVIHRLLSEFKIQTERMFTVFDGENIRQRKF